MAKSVLSLLLGAFLLFSCSYRLGSGDLLSHYTTIEVPYIRGDLTGEFTASLIKRISESGTLEYKNQQAELILYVTLLDFDEENIGYRYDRKKCGELTKSIIPVEMRLAVSAEVSLIEAYSGNTVMGPVRISAAYEFDHDYYSSRNAVNIFSLGQLSDIDAARDIAERPLSEVLAQKITDYINHSW